ncbi:MAG: HD domain-containing protein [Deltaproteobacteria bacterium]|nr:HD domain-containing protein [Deltaproteobacteria bacterium]
MKRQSVKEIKEGLKVDSTLLVARKETGVSKSGKSYLALKLMDSTGELEARVWDNAQSLAEGFTKDDVCSVKGVAISYQGKIQINITDIKRVAEGQFEARDYLPSSKKDPLEMMAELDSVVSDMRDVHLRGLLSAIFADRKARELFMLAPAAKTMHHPYLGGLLEHTLSMCKLGNLVSQHYGTVNRDLLMAGCILHDIGKIYELSYSKSFDYTDEGRLLGHITMGVGLVDSRIKETAGFPPNLAMLLKHMILSHHGHLEFGSPKRPKTIEALLLYYLDDLDAKVNSIESLKEKSEGAGNWTDYQRLFERYIYKGGYRTDEKGGDVRDNDAGKDLSPTLFKS